MEHNTAKHFALQLGALISLYLSIAFLLVLIFGIINLLFPDAAEGYWAIESAGSSVRLGIAMVIVFFPTYVILTRIVNSLRRAEPEGKYLTLTKWLIYLSILVAGITLLGDLVAVVMAFLNGEITTRFILKAVALLLVVGAAFQYYLLDAKGYWLSNEKKSIIYGAGASVLVLVALLYGFLNIETPGEVREMKLDEKQVTDLQNIQYQISDYYAINDKLPDSLEQLAKDTTVPKAPELREPYTYEVTAKGFNLCARFAKKSPLNEFSQAGFMSDKTSLILNPDNWDHKDGEYCFERVINKNAAVLPQIQNSEKPLPF